MFLTCWVCNPYCGRCKKPMPKPVRCAVCGKHNLPDQQNNKCKKCGADLPLEDIAAQVKNPNPPLNSAVSDGGSEE